MRVSEFKQYIEVNALVDRGWLRELSCVELAVMLVYLRIANQNSGGIAFPSTMQVMEIIGHKSRTHVWNARTALVNKGLLRRLPDRDGVAVYQITVSGAPESGALSAPENGAHRIPVRTEPGGAGAPESGTGAHRNPVQGTNELTNERTNEEGAVKSKKAKPGKDLPEIPKALDGGIFNAAWKDWIQHRSEINKPLTPKAAEKQLKKCVELGVRRAVCAIEYSIVGGWQGIFEQTRASSNGQSGNGERRAIGNREDN